MGELLSISLGAALLVPATLLPIINPLVGAPIFMGMTGDNRRLTAEVARRVGLNCFFLLAGSLFVGGYVLEFFGVSIPAVRVAGGILVGSTAWRLLNGSPLVNGVVLACGDSRLPPHHVFSHKRYRQV